jgi:hypothetical protein
MDTYTLPLALQDFMPVLLSSVGMYLLVQRVRNFDRDAGRLALLGFALIAAGGFFKATWKLEMATFGTDIAVLNNSLFMLLAPGFTCMAWAMANVSRILNGQPKHESVWRVPMIVIVVFSALSTLAAIAAPQGRSWAMVLLMLTTVGNVSLSVLLIRQSLREGMRSTALLFAFNLLVVFMMTGMARIPDQTIPLQWTAQITNTLSQAAFAYGAWKLTMPSPRLVQSALRNIEQ